MKNLEPFSPFAAVLLDLIESRGWSFKDFTESTRLASEDAAGLASGSLKPDDGTSAALERAFGGSPSSSLWIALAAASETNQA